MDVLLRTRCGCSRIVWIHDPNLPQIKVNMMPKIGYNLYEAPVEDCALEIETRVFKYMGDRDRSTHLRVYEEDA
jgi:hypothetical protein